MEFLRKNGLIVAGLAAAVVGSIQLGRGGEGALLLVVAGAMLIMIGAALRLKNGKDPRDAR